MSKLFALENDDVDAGVVGEAGDEMAVVADATAEIVEDGAAGGEVAENIDVGVDATEDLGAVEEVLTAAVDSGEGLNEVAAEAVRIAVASICKNIGADPKRVYPLYATENFAAASSRLANTKLALEGVVEFGKDVYKRIKAALESLWKKIKAFWDKHISTLGRVKKAAEALKKQVAKAKELKGAPFIDSVPGGLLRAFNPTGQLEAAQVETVIAAHKAFSDACGAYLTKSITGGGVAVGDIQANRDKLQTAAAAVTGKNLVGGNKIEFKFTAEDDSVSFEIDRTPGEADPENKGMVVAGKDKLGTVMTKVIELIEASVAARKEYDKKQTASAKALESMYKAAEAITVQADKATAMASMRLLYKASTFDGRVSQTCLAENIRGAKAGMSYVAFCLKSYK